MRILLSLCQDKDCSWYQAFSHHLNNEENISQVNFDGAP